MGAALDGAPVLRGVDELVTVLPGGASLAATTGRGARPTGGAGRHAAARARAERVALGLGQTLAAAVGERAARLVAAGALKDAEDAAHLTWDELLAPPPDLAGIVERRRAEHDRLSGIAVPATISVTGTTPALPRAAVTA